MEKCGWRWQLFVSYPCSVFGGWGWEDQYSPRGMIVSDLNTETDLLGRSRLCL
jgi:hypothetical protein